VESATGGFHEVPGEGIPGYTIKAMLERGPETGLKHMVNIVNVEPGSGKFAHTHTTADTFFVFLEGVGEYIYDENGNTVPVKPGDIAISLAGMIHGTKNTGQIPMRYLAVEGPLPEGGLFMGHEPTRPSQAEGLTRVQTLGRIAAEDGFIELPGEGIPGYTIKRVMPRGLTEHMCNIVNVEAGSGKFAHAHEDADTVLIILEGVGEFRLDEAGNTVPIEPGDICISSAGQTHGTINTGAVALKYLCIEGPLPSSGLGLVGGDGSHSE
jgi:mannose-6-phosphate isomerase-like protein (cupin superfamily)